MEVKRGRSKKKQHDEGHEPRLEAVRLAVAQLGLGDAHAVSGGAVVRALEPVGYVRAGVQALGGAGGGPGPPQQRQEQELHHSDS